MSTREVIVPLNALPAPRDTFARPVRDLRISVMDRCNFRCPYCMPRETYHEQYRFLGSQERLSFDEVVLLARYASELKAAGLKRVTVSLDSLDAGVFARTSGGFGGLDDVLPAIAHA